MNDSQGREGAGAFPAPGCFGLSYDESLWRLAEFSRHGDSGLPLPGRRLEVWYDGRVFSEIETDKEFDFHDGLLAIFAGTFDHPEAEYVCRRVAEGLTAHGVAVLGGEEGVSPFGRAVKKARTGLVSGGAGGVD